MSKVCYLQKAEVTLEDGEVYTVRKLPLTPAVLQSIEDMSDNAKSLKAMLSLIKISLSYDYEKDQIDDLFESGIIPFDPEKLIKLFGAIFPHHEVR